MELQYIFLFLKQKTTKIVVQVAVSGRSFTITSVTVIHFLNGFAAGGKKKQNKTKHVLNHEEFNIVEVM